MDSQLTDADALQRCRTSLHALRRFSDDVCELMRGLARVLRDTGRPPSLTTLDQLAQYRSEYEQLRAEVPRLGNMTGNSSEGSLEEIETELESLALVRATFERLELVPLIRHIDQIDFAPWRNCLADGMRVREQLLVMSAADARDAAEQFLSKPALLNAAITMITDCAALSDERWSLLLDAVSEGYGRELSTAIARGKLILMSNASA
ncbi:MAG: hypothetical protein WCJ09_18535 [Planctomycetota bacterium]